MSVIVLRVKIKHKINSSGLRKKLALDQQFTLLFTGHVEENKPTECWKEDSRGEVSPFGKVLFSQHKRGRVRINKGDTIYFSDQTGVEGEYKETHPKER